MHDAFLPTLKCDRPQLLTCCGYFTPPCSWGDQWGEKGFFRVRILSGDGVCGINKNPSVVLSSRYSKSPPPMSTSPITDEGIGVQNICAVALGVMGIVSLILGCGCGESQPEAPYPSNQYTKSPAFLYGAVERLERRREDKAKAKVRMEQLISIAKCTS